MEQFKKYAGFYDLFYQKKEYEKEVAFVLDACKKYAKSEPKRILSLGCGTGTYELLFAGKGIEVDGVDLSDEMLMRAREKGAREPEAKVTFSKGDVRTFRNDKSYDLVAALFNIVGYQHTTEDNSAFWKTAAAHLPPGGLFIFDAWYAPAIRKDPPQDREKEFAGENGAKIKRKTTQRLDLAKKILDITFSVKEFREGIETLISSENHPMRFFDLAELESYATEAGFSIKEVCVFPELGTPATDSRWDIAVIAQKP